jgi:hypothetical protein
MEEVDSLSVAPACLRLTARLPAVQHSTVQASAPVPARSFRLESRAVALAAATVPDAIPSPVAVLGDSGTASAAAGSSTAGVVNTSIPGSANVGKGDGSQFITGQCFSNADCASGCCAGLNGAAVCSGPAVGNANGKTGCGFTLASVRASSSAASPAAPAAAAAAADAAAGTGSKSASAGVVNTNLAGSQNVGKGNGSQFITGQCFSNADCGSGCCAGLNGAGQCSGPAVAFDAGKTGCGFTV